MYAVVYTTAHYPIAGTFVPEIIAGCTLVSEVKLLAIRQGQWTLCKYGKFGDFLTHERLC